ncbi:MAG: 4-alpha-glucanotransferase [Spirochaetaceae bacterium]|nr:4-alpha-glucanotransferase [Spirochaetaceae bacterium]
MLNNKRSSGILFHITSLPGKYGIGDFGNEAYSFVDQLEKTGVKLWQTLPLGPTGYGNSPYSSRSTFAGNELLISLDKLINDKYLSSKDIKNIPEFSPKKVDFNKVEQWKKPLLFIAAKNFIKVNKEKIEYKKFVENNKWLDDYCLFISIYDEYNDSRWDSVWDEKLKNRDEKALELKRLAHKDKIEYYSVLQYLFFKQWFSLKTYANKKDIKIIGDIPIFVARDSVDAWTNRELFKTDAKGDFSYISGCPPDGFTPLGQLWGTPVYDWDSCEKSGFKWWIKRMKHQLNLCDILRIDHFRGFEAYWEVKAGSPDATNGEWTKGPGKKLFEAINKELGKTPLIAEDLGFMTEDVIKLRTDLELPGMKIGVFGFSFDKDNLIDIGNTDLPYNYDENCFAYPGTHDNTTIQQWFSGLTTAQKDSVCEYLATDYNNIHNALIREIYHSKANNVVVMITDLMGLSHEGRMNTPSSCNDINWSWRLDRSLDTELRRLSRLIKYSHRD